MDLSLCACGVEGYDDFDLSGIHFAYCRVGVRAWVQDFGCVSPPVAALVSWGVDCFLGGHILAHCVGV